MLLLWHPKATGVIPPVVSPSTATPGRVLFSGLTGRRYDEEKRQEIPTVPHGTFKPDVTADYVRELARLSRALTSLQDERIGLLANIARLETIQTARAEHELTMQRQALQFAAAKEAMILEQLEVIDVAYCAATILTLH